MSYTPPTKLSCRQIQATDLPAVTDLLHEGFPKRSRNYWVKGLKRLAAHTPPPNCPRFGHVLEARGTLVGVLLTIFSTSPDGFGPVLRSNVSSWYVVPAFRIYAPLLVLRALRPDAAGYLNVSPADGTLPIITAQGFTKFCGGVFAALPMLQGSATPVQLIADPQRWRAISAMPEEDLRLLRDHAAFGCLGLWCETSRTGQPFIFRRRWVKAGGIPCAQLIYCRSLEELERHAGAIGRFLALRGLPLVLVPSERPLRGVPGRHFPNRLPMYFYGAVAPRIGDLSYTEAAVFGF
jgi:hypothetical protein